MHFLDLVEFIMSKAASFVLKTEKEITNEKNRRLQKSLSCLKTSNVSIFLAN